MASNIATCSCLSTRVDRPAQYVKPSRSDDVERGEERRLADRDRYAAPAQDMNKAGGQAVDIEISRVASTIDELVTRRQR